MVLSLVVEPVLESSGATLIFVLLLAISVSEVIMARFVVRKQIAQKEESSETQARVLASAFAGAIAVYGLIIGILTGHWFLVVPFGAIAFFASRYLHDLIEEENEPLRLGSRR